MCGIMRIEDALAASEAGADAIGMIFYKESPRCISTKLARAIVTALPPYVEPVGVFVGATSDQVVQVAADVGLRTVQLQGAETPEFIRDLEDLEVVKAIHVDPETVEQDLVDWRTAIESMQLDNLAGFLLETARTGQPGGSGVANDWRTIHRLQKDGIFEGLPPLIAAGGLTPQNVADVVRQIHPWAVDVASGIEESKGVKSRAKIDAFVAAVRAADAG